MPRVPARVRHRSQRRGQIDLHHGRGDAARVPAQPGSAIVMELWETHATPAENRGNDDAIARGFRLPPPKNGSVFRIIEDPPGQGAAQALAAWSVLDWTTALAGCGR